MADSVMPTGADTTIAAAVAVVAAAVVAVAAAAEIQGLHILPISLTL